MVYHDQKTIELEREKRHIKRHIPVELGLVEVVQSYSLKFMASFCSSPDDHSNSCKIYHCVRDQTHGLDQEVS